MKKARDYDWSGKIVLIAEDSEPSIMYFRAALKHTGLRLLFASNGRDAVEIFQKNPDIHLVLMDLDMPVMNGLEASDRILKINKDVPIIAQTAHVYPGDLDDSHDAGCLEFMPKPIPLEILYTTLDRYLGK